MKKDLRYSRDVAGIILKWLINIKKIQGGTIMGIDETFRFVGRKVIICLCDRVCETSEELVSSELFSEVINRFVSDLKRKRSPLLKVVLFPVTIRNYCL